MCISEVLRHHTFAQPIPVKYVYWARCVNTPCVWNVFHSDGSRRKKRREANVKIRQDKSWLVIVWLSEFLTWSPSVINHFSCDRRTKYLLQLHFVSTSNEITLVGDHMKSDLLPTGIFSELRQSNNDWHSTKSYWLWRFISFDVLTACCLNINRYKCGRLSHENWFIADEHHVRTPTIKQRLTFN